ncbi:MAG TPA: agglutinin biogenesis protein MshI [Burkholderiales bacterium]|nr:agglutinin biogenesis protein MshI [Burkholderiales bacterium]
MIWTRRKKTRPGWLAVTSTQNHIDVAHVKRGGNGRPEITLCDSFGKEGASDAETLSRICKELKLERYRCTTLLKRSEYQLHRIDAPNVPRAELKAATRWRVKDLIDYPLESATVDVLDIPSDPEAATSARVVYAVTAPATAVEHRRRAFGAARLDLTAIDLPELAQRNIAALFEPKGCGVVMLSFSDTEGLLTCTRDGELYNARRIEVSLPQLLDSDATRRNAHLERIALEVQRSLDHLGREYHYVPLTKLLLGPLPLEVGLTQYVADNVDLPVEAIDLSSVMDFSTAPKLKQIIYQARYLWTLGAALRDEGIAA